jgi:hypothetical protein
LRLHVLNGSLMRHELDVLSFISEGADPSTVSSHSLPRTQWKSWLFASQPPAPEFVCGLHITSSHFPDIASALHLGTLYHCYVSVTPNILSPTPVL